MNTAGAKSPTSGSAPNLPIALRLPFVELIGGLRRLGPNVMNDLVQNYADFLVGAKGFMPPEGIGMVSSKECYIGILRPEGHSILAFNSGQAHHETIDGNDVWTWSAPPYEGYPRATTFYAAEIPNGYLVLGNDLAEFNRAMQTLINKHDFPANIGWEPSSPSKYWIYRSVRGREATQIDERSNAVLLKFVIDSAMQSHIEIDTSSNLSKLHSSGLPASETLHYLLKGIGTWQAEVPMSRDPATTTALFKVFSAFGFAVVL